MINLEKIGTVPAPKNPPPNPLRRPAPSPYFHPQTFQVTRIWRDFPTFFQHCRIPLAFLKYVFFPAFSEICYSFSLRSLFFLKIYIFLSNTFKRGYSQSFFALLSCVVTRSLKYRLAHSNCLNHQDHTVPKNRSTSFHIMFCYESLF